MISASLTCAFVLLPRPGRAAEEDARAARAAAVPRLSVGAILGGGWGAYARLTWPTERVRPRALPSGLRAGVAERMAELRRRIAELCRTERTVEQRLALDEAEAELSALDGELP